MKVPPCNQYEPPAHIEVKSKLNKTFCRKKKISLKEKINKKHANNVIVSNKKNSPIIVSNKKNSPLNKMNGNLLDINGYITVPIYPENDLKGLRQEFLNECKNFQEFKTIPNNEFVLGGFGALGNPSSFHNPFVRKIRMTVYKKACAIFSELYPKKNIECLFDRMMLRVKGNAPSKESWHRDITPNLKSGDKMFGGWLNLDDTPQYFSCVPGTHKVNEEDLKKKGFAAIKKDSTEFKKFNEQKIQVEIPPGHCIIFFQHIIHEVLAKKMKHDSYRIFNSFRITNDTTPVFNIESVLDNQSVARLPSNQIPPMYAKLHWTNWVDKIEKWSTRMNDKCVEERYMKTKNKSYRVVHQHMNSLSEYGFKLYPKYTENERKIFKPNPLK